MIQTAEAFGLGPIAQVSMNARDLSRAVAFYRDVLGMRLLLEAPKLALLDAGGIRLMLARPESPEFDHPGSVLYFRVPRIQEAHDTLAARGVSFKSRPHVVARAFEAEIWMAFFADSEGNTLAILSEVKSG